MQDLEEKLEEKIAAAQSDEEVIKIFAEAGVYVTADQLNAPPAQEDGELSEDTLDTISGGGLYSLVKRLINLYNANRYTAGGGGYSSGGGGNGAFGGGDAGGR